MLIVDRVERESAHAWHSHQLYFALGRLQMLNGRKNRKKGQLGA
jgi:hypothetical protein